MKEELIDFSTAKLAKEKGFGVKVNNYFRLWYDEVQERTSSDNIDFNEKFSGNPDIEEFLSRPTQGLLQKWLGEEHGVYAYLDFASLDVVIVDYKSCEGKVLLRKDSWDFCPDYEKGELLDKLLQEALKLINPLKK